MPWDVPRHISFSEFAVPQGDPSDPQLRLIELVAQGLKNSEVAATIRTTQQIVENHLGRSAAKLSGSTAWALFSLRFISVVT